MPSVAEKGKKGGRGGEGRGGAQAEVLLVVVENNADRRGMKSLEAKMAVCKAYAKRLEDIFRQPSAQ